jgi:hypothetical protein
MKKTTLPARDDQAWRQFPVFERVLGTTGRDPVLDRVADVCRRLHDAAERGAEAEKNRARAALVAFGRTLDLLQHLAAVRDKQHEPEAAR